MNAFIASLKSLQSRSIARAFLKELPDLIFIIDREGTFLDFFVSNEKLLTVPTDSIVGSKLSHVFPAEHSAELMKHLKEELKGGEGTVFEYQLMLNHSLHYFKANLVRENEHSVAAFIRDVTEIRKIQLKEAEHHRAIEESERRFRLLADHLPGAVYLCNNDADFSMIYLNDKVFEITGYEPHKFISKEINFPDIYFPDDVERIYKIVGDSLQTKKSFHLEYRVIHKSGTVKWIEEIGTGVYDKEGALICLEGYLQDISERKITEQKILQQNDELKKANDELDRFVYSASHDLKSPLSSLLGLINLISLTKDHQEKELLIQMMKERVKSMEHFIREITFYSQNSRLEVEAAEVHLFQVVESCLSELSHAEDARGIHFEVVISGDQKIKTDERRLKIILNNLISNAIKYSDAQKEVKWVKIIFDQQQENIITISDNGLGIAEEFQSRIFEMFFRASEKSNGSGLGLYIVKETIAKLRGRVEFTSQVGEGSVFKIYLPK
jgi:PAS domain S-box-containing protein